MNSKNTTTPIFFGFIFLLLCYLIWLMAQQMIGPIIFGLILAGVFSPFNYKIMEKWNLSRNLSSILTSLLIILVVLLPLIFLAISLSKEALNLYQSIKSGLNQSEVHDFLFGEGFVASLLKKISSYLDTPIDMELLKEKIFLTLKGISGGVLSGINALAGDIFNFIFDLIIMMIVTFAILVEGSKLKEYIFELSPLPEEQEQTILEKFNQMNYVTLVCNGVGGVIQGVLGGIALWIAGIDSIILWTVLMIFLAFIPLIGISVVTVPASIYLLLTGHAVAGITLFVFTAVVGIVVENWFKPKFIGDRIQINSTFVLLSIIGGMGIFGMAGIFYGPIISILFITLVEIYHDYYKQKA